MEEPGRLQSMGSLESDMTERLHFHALEKEMATPSSVLHWRILWTEKPSGLQPMGCKESDTTERLTFSSIRVSSDELALHIMSCYTTISPYLHP